MNSYRALFEVKQFVGYALWWVRVRTKPKQRWAEATLYAGRTGTESQAWGMVARTLADIPIKDIRLESGSWAAMRDHLRQPGEARRFEGSTAWAAESAALGTDGLAALGQEGEAFRTAFFADLKRREQANYREFIDGLEWAVFMEFCRETDRDMHDRGAEALGAYARWKAERFETRNRQREQAHQGFRFIFTTHTKADDLRALGVSPTATAGDIKTAWRRLAMRHHPDRGGDHGEFIRLKAAYERLSGEAGL